MINPLTPGYYYPQQVFQHIYIYGQTGEAFSAVKSRTGYSTRMFLASPAKQFLTTSACLPACRPAGHWNFQWSSSVVWFHFVASSMNTHFNNSYVARERGWIYQGQFYLHPAWCPPLLAAGFQIEDDNRVTVPLGFKPGKPGNSPSWLLLSPKSLGCQTGWNLPARY